MSVSTSFDSRICFLLCKMTQVSTTNFLALYFVLQVINQKIYLKKRIKRTTEQKNKDRKPFVRTKRTLFFGKIFFSIMQVFFYSYSVIQRSASIIIYFPVIISSRVAAFTFFLDNMPSNACIFLSHLIQQ